MTEKFHNGSLCTYRVRDTFLPRTPAQCQALAAAHGMPLSLCPAYAGDREMARRAIQTHVGKAEKAGWLVKALGKAKDTLTFTIARIDKDLSLERTDYAHESVVRWSSEEDNGEHITGWHDVAQEMDRTYQTLRGMVLATDWTQHVIDYIKGPCRGVAFLEQGGFYWIPPQGTQDLEQLRTFLDAVGIGLVIGEIAPESHTDVQQVAQAGLDTQLDALRADVDAFDGSQPPKVYRGRLARLRELRATAMAYNSAIGIKLDEVRAVLGTIETKTRALLTVRLETTIHKDGTRERHAGPPVADQVAHLLGLVAQGEQALAQALTDGALVVDASPEDIAQLDDMDEGGEGTGETIPHMDTTLTDAIASVPDLDPRLAALLAAPTPPRDLPTTW